MESEILLTIGSWVGLILLFVFGIAIMLSAFYKKVPQGYALIVNDMSSKPKVHFTGGMVYPVINKMEIMKISLITLEIDRRAKDGLICKR